MAYPQSSSQLRDGATRAILKAALTNRRWRLEEAVCRDNSRLMRIYMVDGLGTSTRREIGFYGVGLEPDWNRLYDAAMHVHEMCKAEGRHGSSPRYIPPSTWLPPNAR